MAVNDLDIIRVATKLVDILGFQVVNVWHFKCDLITPPSTDALVMADLAARMELIYTEILTDLHNSLTFLDINFFNVTQDAPMGTLFWPTLTTGGAGGDPMPSQAAAMVRAETGKSRNWARKFFGTFGEGTNTSLGLIVAGAVTHLVNLGAVWITPYAGVVGTYIPVVWYNKDAEWRSLTRGIVRNVWSTVRRRRAGRGA